MSATFNIKHLKLMQLHIMYLIQDFTGICVKLCMYVKNMQTWRVFAEPVTFSYILQIKIL